MTTEIKRATLEKIAQAYPALADEANYQAQTTF